MTWTQKKEVMADINEAALVLLEFYYSKSNLPDYDYKDERVSKALDWTITKVRDNRIKLEKKEYFKKVVIRGRVDTQTRFTLGHERWSR